ncbi:MAG: matrixin family metalloprotease [Verrucomicrobia bacterium]|nr:matrixin family metalloprotease [Verrucomicrobiota bacterium]
MPACFRIRVGSLVLAAVAALTSVLPAYDLIGPRWASGANVVLNLALGTPSAPLLDGSTSWDQVAAAALTTWNAQLGSGVRFTSQTATTFGQWNGRNEAAFSPTVYGQSFNGAIAITTSRYIGTTFTEADVIFDSSRSWNAYRGSQRGNVIDLYRTALHEFGHVLGLDHPDQAGQSVAAIMNSIISNLDALQADDIAGVRAIYGAPTVTPTPTPTPTPPPAAAGRLINVSTRVQVAAGDRVAIAGFVVTGTASKRFAVRALGPSLADFGVSAPLADPTLRVLDSRGVELASNDNWQSGASASALQSAGFAPSRAVEAAVIVTLAPGSYSGIVASAAPGGTGVASVEVYELDGAGSARAANLSTRGFVGAGQNQMIGGFVVSGGTRRVVVRGLGPSLANFGVAGALSDPVISVRNANGTEIATSNNWAAEINAATLANLNLAPTSGAEAATVLVLDPGAYTVVVSSAVAGQTGIALFEVYEVP